MNFPEALSKVEMAIQDLMNCSRKDEHSIEVSNLMFQILDCCVKNGLEGVNLLHSNSKNFIGVESLNYISPIDAIILGTSDVKDNDDLRYEKGLFKFGSVHPAFSVSRSVLPSGSKNKIFSLSENAARESIEYLVKTYGPLPEYEVEELEHEEILQILLIYAYQRHHLSKMCKHVSPTSTNTLTGFRLTARNQGRSLNSLPKVSTERKKCTTLEFDAFVKDYMQHLNLSWKLNHFPVSSENLGLLVFPNRYKKALDSLDQIESENLKYVIMKRLDDFIIRDDSGNTLISTEARKKYKFTGSGSYQGEYRTVVKEDRIMLILDTIRGKKSRLNLELLLVQLEDLKAVTYRKSNVPKSLHEFSLHELRSKFESNWENHTLTFLKEVIETTTGRKVARKSNGSKKSLHLEYLEILKSYYVKEVLAKAKPTDTFLSGFSSKAVNLDLLSDDQASFDRLYESCLMFDLFSNSDISHLVPGKNLMDLILMLDKVHSIVLRRNGFKCVLPFDDSKYMRRHLFTVGIITQEEKDYLPSDVITGIGKIKYGEE